jgi:spermidine synthase
LLLLLSAGSGIAALIYEIVWFQLLELVVGSTAVSLALLLAVFMGGTCLGSLLFPRLPSTRRNPLAVYATLEIGIAVFGLLGLFLIPLAGRVYISWSGDGVQGLLLRGAVAAICLLPPTLLMGATLPALARAKESGGVSSLGMLYALNIVGAVAGCLFAGFYLLREYDTSIATYVAVGINLALAALALTVRSGVQSSTPSEGGIPAGHSRATVYLVVGLSGCCALGCEAIWTRDLGLLFGASVYTFSVILAVFLTGLGLGSGLGSWLTRRLVRPWLALGYCQVLVAVAIAWSAYSMNVLLPFWPIDLLHSSIWTHFGLDLARAGFSLLPATILWGASFPLALAAADREGEDAGGLVARLYSANTLGGIVGALGASLLLVAWTGSQHTQQVLIGLSAIAGLLVAPGTLRALAGVLLAGSCIYAVPPIDSLLITHGRYAASWAGKGEIVYAREGINSSVGVTRFPDDVVTFHVAGKIQASNNARDMRLQRMLGHLTTLASPHPRSVLVIGCGAGITAGAVSIDPLVERETIVEIEPLVPQAAARYFYEANWSVLSNPKVHLRIDDGRHFLLTTKERFDGITIDPLDPWVKGAASLYTKEFFEAMKQHLNPGGTVTMYIQLFETTDEAVRIAAATFFEVFPNGSIWGNPYQGKGHDMVLLGQVEPLLVDLDEMEQRVDFRGDSELSRSLSEVGMNSPVELFATYAGRASDLKPWLQGAAINRDGNLRMQYLAGLGLDRDDSAAIYAEMLQYRRFPEDAFVSREGRVESLRQFLRRGP